MNRRYFVVLGAALGTHGMTARSYAEFTTVEDRWKRFAMVNMMRHLPASWIVRSMLKADLQSWSWIRSRLVGITRGRKWP